MDYDDRGLAALPKLVGGPRYTRPPRTGVTPAQRPASPDDLPLVSERNAEDHTLAAELHLDASPLELDTVPPPDGQDGEPANGSGPDLRTPRPQALAALFRGRAGDPDAD